MAARALTDDPE